MTDYIHEKKMIINMKYTAAYLFLEVASSIKYFDFDVCA